MEKTESKVGIVILNYNNYEDTIECIKSVQEIEYQNYEIIIVDNCSKNDSVDRLKKEFGDSVTFIVSDVNLGYAGGNNLGIEYAADNGHEFVCVLNNDTIVEKNFLRKCVMHLQENSDVAFVGPVVLEYDNDKVQSTGGRVIEHKGLTALLNNGNTRGELEDVIECDFISGACIVFRVEILNKLGFIPENYFLFYEETEWCYKAKKKGYRNVCINNTFIRHKGSISINQVSGLSAYLMARNRVVFCKRNFAFGIKYIGLLLYLFAETIYRVIRYDKNYIQCIPAYWDGVRNRVSEKYPFIIIKDNG